MLNYPVSEYIMTNMTTINHMIETLHGFLRKHYKRTSVMLLCRGSSGAILAGLTAYYLIEAGYTVQIIHIKKDGETSHGKNYVGKIPKNYITVIIDDIIATGATMKNICKAATSNNSNLQIDVVCVSGTVENPTVHDLPIRNIICE